MLFSSLLAAVSLAVLPATVGAGPIKGNQVNCRSGPATKHDVVKVYNKDTDVKITCQTEGEDIKGNKLWDKTDDGCYVTDYYTKTDVKKKCDKDGDGGGGGGGDGDANGNSGGKSDYKGKISRKEIMARGQVWIDEHVPYSMKREHPDPQGRDYRTDCSGFVSMALHAQSPGFSTVSLPEIAESIEWKDLKKGDFVGTLGAGTGGANGHVVLFDSWADDSHKEFKTIECKGSDGCVAYKRPINFKVGSHKAKPYKYKRVEE